VTRLASKVSGQPAEAEDGAHLILLMELDRPYLADVGFGNGLLEPIPLEAGSYRQGFRMFHLAQEGERWFFTNYPDGGPGFNFTLRARALVDFAPYCTYLQTLPESWFVRTTVCHRCTSQRVVSLIGAVLRTITADGPTKQVIESREAYQQTLCGEFGLSLPEAEVSSLWQTVWERHLAWVEAGHP
jgi:N-hydroxyarylamine O-acetyltransferase